MIKATVNIDKETTPTNKNLTNTKTKLVQNPMTEHRSLVLVQNQTCASLAVTEIVYNLEMTARPQNAASPTRLEISL
jgi:hypothetical protein